MVRKKDYNEIVNSFTPLCDYGQTFACSALAAVAKKQGNLPHAFFLEQRICDTGKDADPCEKAGLLAREMGNVEDAQKYFALACDRDKIRGPGCVEYGELEAQKGNQESAQNWYSRGCREGSEKGCKLMRRINAEKCLNEDALVLLKENGQARTDLPDLTVQPTSVRNSISIFQKSCALGNAKACGRLARWINDYSDDKSGLMSLYQKGCELKDAGACWGVGTLIKDSKESEKWVRQSCDMGAAAGCEYAANIDLAAARSKEALTLRQRACSLDSHSCLKLKELEAKIAAGEKLLSLVDPLHEACMKGDQQKCDRLGTLLAETHWSEAKRILTKNCSSGYVQSCFVAGTYLRKQGNYNEAKPLLETACHNKHNAACVSLGRLLIAQGDFRQGNQLFSQGCRNMPSYWECIEAHRDKSNINK